MKRVCILLIKGKGFTKNECAQKLVGQGSGENRGNRLGHPHFSVQKSHFPMEI